VFKACSRCNRIVAETVVVRFLILSDLGNPITDPVILPASIFYVSRYLFSFFSIQHYLRVDLYNGSYLLTVPRESQVVFCVRYPANITTRAAGLHMQKHGANCGRSISGSRARFIRAIEASTPHRIGVAWCLGLVAASGAQARIGCGTCERA
jgi:hypothetical protein